MSDRDIFLDHSIFRCELLGEEVARVAAESVVRAGRLAASQDFRYSQVKTGESHRSVVTDGDRKSEAEMIRVQLAAYPNARVLSEENADNPNMLNKSCPTGLMEAEIAFINDPIDGTTPYAARLGNWCVSAGVMRRGQLVAGAIFSPEINGGWLVVAERERGVFGVEGSSKVFLKHRVGDSPESASKSIVLFGVDSTMYQNMAGVFPKVAGSVKSVGISGSGLLALAQLADRRVQAVVQTPQRPWDWAGGYVPVLESGSVFKFFRLDGEELVFVDPDWKNPQTFSADKEHRLGFVAGEPHLVEAIAKLLPRTGFVREKKNADFAPI